MNAVWQQREEARRYLRANTHSSSLPKAVKMAGANVGKVGKAAVLSFFWDFVRHYEKTRSRRRPGRLLQASKDDESGRKARPHLGVR